MSRLLALFTVLGFSLCAYAEPCQIRVVDAENGWPVPLVKLRTTHEVSFYTDNAGVIAFDLPELMHRETWFHVSADGYEVDKDGFGNRGIRLTPEPGGDLEIKVNRTNIAKRLGRLTGAGIFAESQKLGERLDWKESGILGSDSIQTAIHRGRKFWAWGDTNVSRYPLGLFHMTCATTDPKVLSQFEPPIAIHLDYFRDEASEVRNVADLGGKGPTWISGYVSIQDGKGEDHLVGCYNKIEPPLSSYRTGLCVWNDETGNFESIKILWERSGDEKEITDVPKGNPAFWKDPEGKEWLYFGNPLPTLRMPATFEAWQDPTTWEVLKPRKTLKDRYGNDVKMHGGSIVFHPYRKRWVTIFMEREGDPSLLGETWYAEAETPLGPWGAAVKVVSHREHSFYNPRIHPGMTPDGSPILLFEGTYTKMFTKAEPTPRYEYNQILYRLDLDDPKLKPAQTAE